MAFIPSRKAKNLAGQIAIEPNLILAIDGIPVIFGSQDISKIWKFDEGFLFDTPGLLFDTPVIDPNSRDYISLEMTSRSISQQVLPDRKGTTSTLTMDVHLVDFDGEVTELLKSGNNVKDLIGQDAELFVGFKQGSHPEDSISLISGYVDKINPVHGGYVVTISHAENKKRQEILQVYTAETSQAIKYKEITVTDIFYDQKFKINPVLKIEYILGGAIAANLTGDAITITIVNGVSTAKDVMEAINANPLISTVVNYSLIGTDTNIQTPFALSDFLVDETVTVDSTDGVIESKDIMTTYIQIEDEIMEIVSIDSPTVFSVVRSRLNTVAVSHESGTSVASVYGLGGDDAITMALKMYLSGGDEFYKTLAPTSFGTVNGEIIANSIFFNDIDLTDDFGIVEDDIIVISGATNPENNGTFTVNNIVTVANGSYIVSNGAGFIFESPTGASINFKSQFNVLNSGAGLGLNPIHIDILGHIDTLNQNFSSLPTYQFYLKEEINCKDFIDGELYFPSALYSIGRKAKISVKYTTPPLAIEQTPLLNSENITNISKIKAERSTHTFMYNSIVYKFEKSVLQDDKFLAGDITIDPEAKSDTDNVTHTLKIESNGLRRNSETNILINRQTFRFLQRYRIGAIVYKNVEVLFRDSWNLEIGDVIEFGGTDVLIPNLSDGTRYTSRRLVEIINFKKNISAGKISFDLLETGFDINARYAVFSPSSFLTTNSTKTKLELKLSFFTGSVDFEREKWQQHVGERIRVRNDDYTYDEITTILSLAPENDEILNVEELLLVPPADVFIEIPPYDESDPLVDENYKKRYSYNAHQATITASIDASNFEVSTPERFLIGGDVIIRSTDYTRDSVKTFVISNIVGGLITLDAPLDFIPLINDVVDNMTFKDGGLSYRLI